MARARAQPETADIGTLTHDGRGIAKVDGKTVFVSGALAGESVRFVRRKRRRNYDEAELLEVLTPAPERVEPRCAAFGICGGCSLQHLSQATQRVIKQNSLRDALQRIGGVSPETWLDPIYEAGEGGWHYRRRARLAVKDVAAKNRVLVGFRERHAPYVADMHRCEVLAKPVDGLLDPLSELIAKLSIRARLPQIEVAVGDQQTRLVFRVLDEPDSADRRHFEAFAIAHGITIALQPGGLDSVYDLCPPRSAPLSYRLPEYDVELQFEATDFVQVNAVVNRRMVQHALQLLAPEPDDRVLDLYCGIGNFSLPLARIAGEVLGIEGEQRQVERARANAKRNNLDNVRFLAADLDAIDGKASWLQEPWQRLLLDPARSGALPVVQHIGRMRPKRVVYVSCHPATLARDVHELCTRGYRLVAAGIIDMFPHTAHVESIAVLDKND